MLVLDAAFAEMTVYDSIASCFQIIVEIRLRVAEGGKDDNGTFEGKNMIKMGENFPIFH